ncbi:SNF7 family protein [Acanthamoeba castellanii str. Neff]|uniref:SNF7 family protein n=1 Tax=Acanthamoeba castellanii (strain ATCC 30010 / Neff) TaxID=1257118 RepID=L8GRL2_ACACF|nr:SNF7 family protein [Acanthamoeba castellanii str. Neff]ELR14781.1 SNF7 family protein [Acanthamoeba castellanii str. Neff]
MNFWSERVLPSAMRHTNSLSFTIDQLKSSLKCDGYFPAGLDSIVAEMNRKGMVVAEGQVAAQTAGWGSWLWGNLVARPISWGWSQVVAPAEAEPATVDPKARLVLLPLLKAKADEVLSKHADGVFAADHLVTQRQLLDTTGLNAQDLQILLTYMHANGKAALFETARGEKVAVKLAKAGESKVELNEADKGILQLKETLGSLEKQEGQLSKDIDGCRVKATNWLKKKNKPKAMMELKRKQRLQSVLDKRLSFIENIHQILHTIEQTQTDKEMIDQFKLGVDTLKRVREESGVTVEAVDQVMDDLQDALLDQREIDDAISSGQEQLSSVDEAELEEELAQLVATALPLPAAAVPVAAAAATPVRQQQPEAQQQPRQTEDAEVASLAALLAGMPSVQHLPDPANVKEAKEHDEDDSLPDLDSLQFAG